MPNFFFYNSFSHQGGCLWFLVSNSLSIFLTPSFFIIQLFSARHCRHHQSLFSGRDSNKNITNASFSALYLSEFVNETFHFQKEELRWRIFKTYPSLLPPLPKWLLWLFILWKTAFVMMVVADFHCVILASSLSMSYRDEKGFSDQR